LPIATDEGVPAPGQEFLRPVFFSKVNSLVPHRDSMAPPKLPADAPVSDFLHPVRVSLGPAFRMKCDAAFLHRFGGGFQARIFQEPLLTQIRLDRHMAALAVADVV